MEGTETAFDLRNTFATRLIKWNMRRAGWNALVPARPPYTVFGNHSKGGSAPRPFWGNGCESETEVAAVGIFNVHDMFSGKPADFILGNFFQFLFDQFITYFAGIIGGVVDQEFGEGH